MTDPRVVFIGAHETGATDFEARARAGSALANEREQTNAAEQVVLRLKTL